MPKLISRLISHLDSRASPLPEREVGDALRRQHVHQFGNSSLAYSALTEDYLSTFGGGRGMIVYGQKMGVSFALGDPLASLDCNGDLIDAFLEAFPSAVFVACNQQTANLLSTRGFRINELGYEPVIDLPEWDFGGQDRKRIRYSENWLKSRGGRVAELAHDAVSADQVQAMAREWRQSRIFQREIAFLNRNFSAKPEPDARRFFGLSADGKPMGFIGFDPIFENGKVAGYLASTKRRLSGDTAYLDLAIMAQAIRTFKSEGLQYLNLGIAPIADVRPAGFRAECRWLRHASRYAHQADWINNRIFNSRGLAEYKGRFRGRREPRYICLPPRGSDLYRIVALLILTKIL